MTLTEFKNWAVSQGSVGKYTDGKYVGQCVSLINQYLARVYDIKAGSWGNAKDWATNGTVASYFDKVSSPQAGDIGVSSPTRTNPYGHIWIYLSPTQVLEQNGKVANRVSINAPLFKPIAILRRKQVAQPPKEVKMVTMQQLEVLYRFYLGSTVSDYGKTQRLGKQTFEQAQAELVASDTYKKLVEERKAEQVGFNNHLPVALREVIKLKEQA